LGFEVVLEGGGRARKPALRRERNPREPTRHAGGTSNERDFIDYKTSMITDEDLLRGLLFYLDLGILHTRHLLNEMYERGASNVEQPCHVPHISTYTLAAQYRCLHHSGPCRVRLSLLLSSLELSDTEVYEP